MIVKEVNMDSKRRPIENHKTAAWADIMKTKRHSNVTIPQEEQIIHAKEHVDRNEK
jgi:hypothetical protein